MTSVLKKVIKKTLVVEFMILKIDINCQKNIIIPMN